MIFEIEDIPEGGLNLDLLAAKEQFEINQPDCSLLDDIKLRGRLTKVEQGISFSGELQTILNVACTRCLNLFPYNIETEIKVHFIPLDKGRPLGNDIEIVDKVRLSFTETTVNADHLLFLNNTIFLKNHLKILLVLRLDHK